MYVIAPIVLYKYKFQLAIRKCSTIQCSTIREKDFKQNWSTHTHTHSTFRG